jgi:hypothetical protein
VSACCICGPLICSRAQYYYVYQNLSRTAIVKSFPLLSVFYNTRYQQQTSQTVTLHNSADNLSLTAACVAAVVLRIFSRISAELRSLISPPFLSIIHREFKKFDSSTLPVASHLLAATVACVTNSIRICCNIFHTNVDITVACVTDSDITMVSRIQHFVTEYEERLRRMQRVSLVSYGMDPYNCNDLRFECRVTFISLPDNNHHSHNTIPFNVAIFG